MAEPNFNDGGNRVQLLRTQLQRRLALVVMATESKRCCLTLRKRVLRASATISRQVGAASATSWEAIGTK